MDDLETVRAWRNHPDVRAFMLTQHEISATEHREWFEKRSSDSLSHLLMFEMAGEATGFVQFKRLGTHGVADWGFYLSPAASRGMGKLLGQTALDHAFNQLHLYKVCGQALASNQRSIRMHLSLGFQAEGILREQYSNGTTRQDIHCFGLLAHEWASLEGNARSAR